MNNEQEPNFCECGCGEEVNLGNRFIRGHVWKNRAITDEVKKKMSKARKGEKHPNWRGGVSFEPYCHKFTEKIKEEVRDKFGRVCLLCNKREKENGVKLSVHHCDYNKKQGCDEHEWELVPLCRSCHSKTNFNREYWSEKIFEKLKEKNEKKVD